MQIIEFLKHHLVFYHDNIYFSCPKMLHKFIIIIIIIINVFITESIITVFLHHNHHHPHSMNTLFVTHFFLVECLKPLENIKTDILKLSCCFRK